MYTSVNCKFNSSAVNSSVYSCVFLQLKCSFEISVYARHRNACVNCAEGMWALLGACSLLVYLYSAGPLRTLQSTCSVRDSHRALPAVSLSTCIVKNS